MSGPNADLHLKRAYGLIKGVEQQLQDFRSHVVQHSANMDEDAPFVAGMVSAFQGSRRLASEKAALRQDIDLAWSEIDRAASLDPAVSIEQDSLFFDVTALRSALNLVAGELELISGQVEAAKQCFSQSIQLRDNASSHYMLGVIAESKHNPTEALAEYEKCLELDPDGELTIPALRDANRMRKYEVAFRGSWKTFGCLFLLFFPAAIIYYIMNRK